jgi:hypothetical protein
LQIKTKIVRCHTADSKPVKQDVNSTVILPPLVFPVLIVLVPHIAHVFEERAFKTRSKQRVSLLGYADFTSVFEKKTLVDWVQICPRTFSVIQLSIVGRYVNRLIGSAHRVDINGPMFQGVGS